MLFPFDIPQMKELKRQTALFSSLASSWVDDLDQRSLLADLQNFENKIDAAITKLEIKESEERHATNG